MKNISAFSCPPPPDTEFNGFFDLFSDFMLTFDQYIDRLSIIKKINFGYIHTKIIEGYFCKYLRNSAFTLAEVLITLSIIGIAASLTMPALIAKHQEKVMVTQMKKAYSEFSQAFLLAVNEKGTPDTWGIGAFNDVQGNINMFEVFEPYLKFIKVCEPENNDDCFKLSDSTFNNKAKNGILADGTKIYMFGRTENCNLSLGTSNTLKNICGDITVQISDTHHLRFWLTKQGIVPKGTADTPEEYDSYTFTRCLNESESISTMAESCTAWILQYENLDFLHCKDLSWDGKNTCK